MGTHKGAERLAEALLMSTHNKCFYGEIRKIISELSPNMQSVFGDDSGKIFLQFFICYGYSLEMPCRSTYNEYPQHTLLWRNKKNYPRIITKYASLTSSLVLDYHFKNIDISVLVLELNTISCLVHVFHCKNPFCL